MSSSRAGFLLLFVVTIILYLPAVSAGAVWDDTTLLRGDVLSAWWGPLPFSDNYFRPLGVWSLWLEQRAWGADPTGHHVTNVLLHALNSTLLAALIAPLLPTGRRALAPALALMYAAHPAIVEGVAFISSRFDLLMTTGLLAALLADSRLKGGLRPLIVCVAYLFAACSKEGAAGFPLVLAAWHLSTGASLRSRWRSYAAVVVGGLVYLGLRASALPALYTPGLGDTLQVGTLAQHAMLVAHSLGRYLLLAVWPFGTLSPIQYAELPLTADVGRGALALAVLALAGVAALVRYRPAAGWCTVAGIAALLPALNVVPLQLTGGSFVAERYLLFPLAFFATAAAVALAPVLRWEQRPLLSAGWAAWLAGAAVSTVVVQGHWQDAERLWLWGMSSAPRSSLPATNLSEHLNATGRPQQGLAAAREAMARQPDLPLPWNNTGQSLFLLGDYVGAEAHFRAALERDPDTAFIWTNLGAALMEQGKLGEAEQIFLSEALPREPGSPDAVMNLAGVYLRAGRPDKALPLLEGVLMRGENARASSLIEDTQRPEPWLGLAATLLQSGDLAGSEQALQEAIRRSADPVEVGLSKSALLIEVGKNDEAFQLLKALQQQAPEDARLPYNTAIAVLPLAGPEVARGWFARAAELDPQWSAPREQLQKLDSGQ